jgi:hypothetical protein
MSILSNLVKPENKTIMKKAIRPNDRIIAMGKEMGTDPQINKSVTLKIPDKEVYIMQPGEKPPPGGGGSTGGTCSCNSVCTCVPVSSCNCNMVCTCDTVCSTNLCACNPYSQCATNVCTCVPVCSCDSHCSTCSTCTTGGHYWHPC